MKYVPSGAPFDERGGRLRGVIDLLAGRYPPFLFGFGIGDLLPTFHFHEITPSELERAFRYLAENGYRTVGCDEMAGLVRAGKRPPERSVVLAFDDALASVWLVAVPLLRRFGFKAVTYAVPGRVSDASAVRPTFEEADVDPVAADAAENPFATWPELAAAVATGTLEVQSHTWSHSMIFAEPEPIGVVEPSMREHALNRPRLNVGDPPEFLKPSRLGFPLFARRSRMSDATRFLPDLEACAAVESHVARRGGASFFASANWQGELAHLLGAIHAGPESTDDRRRAIEHELVAAREMIQSKLGVRVQHVCLPWGVTGAVTRDALERLGFETAVANRLPGMYAIRQGDDPFYLKRLPHRHVFALPGKGRRAFRTLA
jgi:peptidoglycan/xylan/chitin deacetylase (PgdA/CDA1 family)